MLTNWVLCTRRPLAPVDESWWGNLKTPFRLDHQVADDLANLLTGDAGLLRETYFGDLVLTPDRLERLNEHALADVRERWFPEVHQSSPAEATLRRMLAEPDAWGHLETLGTAITSLTVAIESEIGAEPLGPSVRTELAELLEIADSIRQLLEDVHQHLSPDGDHTWRELDEVVVPDPPPRTPRVLRKLRASNHPVALACSNLVVHTRDAAVLAKEIFEELAVHCVVVTGDAGYGKTHLSARLTSSTLHRPAGLLLFGRHLRSRDDLDNLAQRISINGKKVETFEALLASVDAAAARAQCRLPIVIDGLNEAEDPNEWKPLLERAQLLLKDYPSVLLVCTLRSAFVDRAIPASLTTSVDLSGFGEEVGLAVQKYFDYFNIDAADVDLPLEHFEHPIALRVFCSVTNPTRQSRVQLVGRVSSLNAMFDEYLDGTAKRIATLSKSRLSVTDVHKALQALGVEMWKTNSREVSETRVKEIFGDTNRLWNDSILHALQEEGVLIRQTSQENEEEAAWSGPGAASNRGELVVSVVYDLLAGHIVASAILIAGGNGFASTLGSPEVAAKFNGDPAGVHPLAVDIFDALAFLLPTHALGHLWEHTQGDLFGAALLRTTDLPAESVNIDTVSAWEMNMPALSQHPGFWARLRSVRAVPNHPLNSLFADRLLRSLSVADRDLTWTEWLRASIQPYQHQTPGADARAMDDLRLWSEHWRRSDQRTEADTLRARWFMWMLTSTVRDLRDAATAALYWYGRSAPSSLFALAADALEINDPYVGERALASAYGVTTTYQRPDAQFAEHLGKYLNALVVALSGDTAIAPTYHRLIRYYAAGTLEFGRVFYPAAVPTSAASGIAFAPGHLPEPVCDGDERHGEVEHTIQMDFGNYTVGRIFHDRSNYDYEHEGHRNAIQQILGVTYELGWRKSEFSSIDQTIGRQNHSRNPGRVERYGKKYGWIGLYFVAGMLNARGDHIYDLEVDIDPTFPQAPPALPTDIPSWVRPTPKDERAWLLDGIVTIPDELMYAETLAGVEGPWVLLHAELGAKDSRTGRDGYGLFNTIAVDPGDLESLMDWWAGKDHPGRDLIDIPTAYYVFAGEIPWHVRMVTSGQDIAGTGSFPIKRNDDGWVDPHIDEDPYIDHLHISLSGAEADEPRRSTSGHLQAEDSDQDSQENVAAEESDYLSNFMNWAMSQRTSLPNYSELEFERLAHAYGWEGHNSSENQTFAYVPSRRLSCCSGLYSVAGGFNQVDRSGRLAAMSFRAPEGFSGHLLYVREDVVNAYAGERSVVSFGFGERQVHSNWPEKLPERLLKVYRDHRNVWRTHRVVLKGTEMPVSGQFDQDDMTE
ncbi:MAG: ATP-binding protein [Actinobacteria bacterium]|nr:ATP-binding protein [Actinomycetota bacterium]